MSEEKKPQSTNENTSSETTNENTSSETTNENTSTETTNENTSSETTNENTSPEISENTSPETKHDSIDNSSNIQNQTITIKKSTYNNMMKGAVVAIAIAAFFGGYLTGTMDSSITNQNLLDAIEEIEITQAAPQAAPQPAQASAPSKPQLIRVSLDDDPVKGDPDAPVTIIEFSDFQCPFCARFFQQTLPLIEKNYIETGKVKLVYRDLPLASIHPNAIPSHIAAECADDQGKFWEYHDILFENQSQWNRLGLDDLRNIFLQYADDLELDAVSYDSCLDSSDIVNEINDDLVDARALGATGTPTFFIGTEKDGFVKISGAQPYSSFQSSIEQILSQ